MPRRTAWKEYEIYITSHFQRLFPNADIKHDVKREGLISRTMRQIDLLIEGHLAGFNLCVIVDCKYFNKKIDVKQVESFLSFLRDLKASKGILITNRGYTDAAQNRALYDSQDIELRLINFDDLHKLQGFWALPYSGSHCALVGAPEGWVVDASHGGSYVCSFYPAGLSAQQAFEGDGFIYLVYSKKDAKWPDLPRLLETQKSGAQNHYNEPKIEYLDTIKRGDCTTLLRIIDAKEMGNSIEYTIFLDYPTVVIFLTLLSPRSKEQAYLRKLEWIAEKLLKGSIVVGKDNRPINFELVTGT